MRLRMKTHFRLYETKPFKHSPNMFGVFPFFSYRIQGKGISLRTYFLEKRASYPKICVENSSDNPRYIY